MNIGGVLVHARPERVDGVWKQLDGLDGVEVHGANENGRMVVTVEKETTGELSDLLLGMQDIPGVLSASVVFHQFEESGQQEAE